MSMGLGLHPELRQGTLRTGLSAAYPDLPWVDDLADDVLTRIEQVSWLLDHEITPLSRHFLMNQLEADAYLLRHLGADYLALYDDTTERHHAEMDSIRPALIMCLGCIPLLDTYRQASIRHKRNGDPGRALLWALRGLEVYGDDAARQEWVDDLHRRVGRLRGSAPRSVPRNSDGRREPRRPKSTPGKRVLAPPPVVSIRRTVPTNTVAHEAESTWHVGSRVLHDAHGMGRVVEANGGTVLVDFGDTGGAPRRVRARDLSEL